MPTAFWLVRHARVAAAYLNYLYGTDDVPICEDQMAADEPIYAALAARLPRPARLVCTPLSRTQVTAAALIRAGYPAQDPLIDPSFIEQDFGSLQGHPITNFDNRAPGTRHPFWPIHAAETPPGGESFAHLISRVGAGLENLAQSHAGQDIVIISHGGAIRAACAHALALNPHQALCLSIENLSLTRLAQHDHGWKIISINEHVVMSACTGPHAASPVERNEMSQPKGALT